MRILIKSLGVFLTVVMLASCVAPPHPGRRPGPPPGHGRKMHGPKHHHQHPGRGHHRGRH